MLKILKIKNSIQKYLLDIDCDHLEFSTIQCLEFIYLIDNKYYSFVNSKNRQTFNNAIKRYKLLKDHGASHEDLDLFIASEPIIFFKHQSAVKRFLHFYNQEKIK